MFPDFLQSGNEWINDNNAVLVDSCSNFFSSPCLPPMPSLSCFSNPSYLFCRLVPCHSLKSLECTGRGNQAKQPSVRSQPLLMNTQPDHCVISSSCSYLPWYCEFLDTFFILSGVRLIHWIINTYQNCPAIGCCHLHNQTSTAGQRQGWYYISL